MSSITFNRDGERCRIVAKKAIITGMIGVYLTAAELSKRGFIVSPTSRGAEGADLLVTDQECQHVYTVQVKTDSGGTFWLLGKNKIKISRTHIYVFVRYAQLKSGEVVKYYVVPSKKVSDFAHSDGKFPSIRREYIEKYEDAWDRFRHTKT